MSDINLDHAYDLLYRGHDTQQIAAIMQLDHTQQAALAAELERPLDDWDDDE